MTSLSSTRGSVEFIFLSSLFRSLSREIAGEVERTASKFNDTYPPKIFPQDKDVKSIDNADEAIRKRLKHTFYTIITPKKVTDTFSIGKLSLEIPTEKFDSDVLYRSFLHHSFLQPLQESRAKTEMEKIRLLRYRRRVR